MSKNRSKSSRRQVRRLSSKVGLTPGSLVYVGPERVEPVRLTLMRYDAHQLEERELSSVADLHYVPDSGQILWLNVDGIHRPEIVEQIGAVFGVHPLILEDVVNVHQRPKLEVTDNYCFFVTKMLAIEPAPQEMTVEQVSVLFGADFVVSFQEHFGDVLDPVRERIRKATPRERFLGADYLAYAIADAIVDHYFIVIEQLSDQMEARESLLVSDPQSSDLQLIHDLKRKLLRMRKAVWPLREVVSGWERSESKLIHSYTRPYLRDLYEHVIYVIDTVETSRDAVSSLLDIYLTSVSNRMNEVMKMLTIIATIFIPLGFLAGIYGMNFETEISPFNMPELSLKYGYLFFWLMALGVAGGLLWFFRRKRWL